MIYFQSNGICSTVQHHRTLHLGASPCLLLEEGLHPEVPADEAQLTDRTRHNFRLQEARLTDLVATLTLHNLPDGRPHLFKADGALWHPRLALGGWCSSDWDAQ